MNNKKLGNDFEQEVCEILADYGFWVHFIVPDARGAQPFDIIAVKNEIAYAIECKTLAMSKTSFPITRLEDNQKLAFMRWMACGNTTPIIVIKRNNDIVSTSFDRLMSERKINIEEAKKNDKNSMCHTHNVDVYGEFANILRR